MTSTIVTCHPSNSLVSKLISVINHQSYPFIYLSSPETPFIKVFTYEVLIQNEIILIALIMYDDQMHATNSQTLIALDT